MLRKLVTSTRALPLQRTLCSKASSDALVLTELDNKTGYATVTMNRAPVNSLNLELMTQLVKTVDDLERSNVKGLILTSSFSKVFSAGLDIAEMINPNPDRLRAVWGILQDLWAKLYGTPFPTVALINGSAPAGGCLLALSCEYRVMCTNFSIGLNEAKLGLIVPPWLQMTMRNTIGARETESACLKGRMFSSQEALEKGLVDELAADKENGKKKALDYLNIFTNTSSYARTGTKLLLRNRDIEDMKRISKDDIESFVKNVMNSEFQNGLVAYAQSLKDRKNK
ncbi:enoyl-CoA delta isomerase 1, mitochondrial-like isoform X2 [Armigeres subalbatus]